MSKKKKHTPHVVIATEAALETAIPQYVDLALKVLRRKARQARALAALQAEHAQENEADDLALLSLESGISLFAIANRELLLPAEKKLKSRDYGCAVLGFRDHPHAVEKVLAKDTWEMVAEKLQAADWGDKYAFDVPTVDKKALLRDREHLTPAQLAPIGILFTQGETFFIEPATALLEGLRVETKESEAA